MNGYIIAMESLKKRTFFKKCRVFGEKESLYEEIKNFIAESRKCQTLYANCEGSYSRRVVNLKDKNTLQNFVYCTTHFDGNQGWHNHQDFSIRKHVEEITERMITASKMFHVEEEIHFGVAWVYYFSYDDKSQKATPVFKIYKNKSGSEAVFLDVSLTLHESWNCYLDYICSVFPVSFLCVPRDGDYRFLSGGQGEENGLDLEFVRTKKLTMKEMNKADCFDRFKPFSQVAVRPWLFQINRFTEDKISEIKRILSILWSKIKESQNKYNVVVFGFLFWLTIKQHNITMVEGLKMIASNSLMLLNTTLMEERSLESVFTPNVFLSNILSTSIPSFSSVNEAQETLKELGCNVKLLLELLKSYKKNWLKILRVFCDLFSHCSDTLLPILNTAVHPLPPLLVKLVLLLKVSGKALNCFMSISETKETDKCQELKSITSSTPVSSELSIKKTGSLQLSECCSGTDKDVEVLNSMTLEKVLSNLPMLETISSEKSQYQLFQESVLELHESQRGFPLISASSRICTRCLFLEEKDGYGIFFISSTSLPQLTSIVSQLIGRHFIFKPEKINIYNVGLTSGKIVGTIFFLQEFSAVGLFLLEAVKEQSHTRLEL